MVEADQDPSVKRTLCKTCFSLLIPGITATTRQKKRKCKARFTVTTCLSCGEKKSLKNNPDYMLWSDRPEAQLQEHKESTSGLSSKNQQKIKSSANKPEGQVRADHSSEAGPSGGI
ncbi:ribonuclease P protein subunit p21 [Boleophthalmus pectinirostris]|uniref:ribonuclease P protein subunit p21 n=1 Tax=Boleophthalmus pectinirostris TaxID=150288 RepID=UPI002432F27A|nr:ribonuclease P protein subunit p21 [Boleophthalmus pectinirostris]